MISSRMCRYACNRKEKVWYEQKQTALFHCAGIFSSVYPPTGVHENVTGQSPACPRDAATLLVKQAKPTNLPTERGGWLWFMDPVHAAPTPSVAVRVRKGRKQPTGQTAKAIDRLHGSKPLPSLLSRHPREASDRGRKQRRSWREERAGARERSDRKGGEKEEEEEVGRDPIRPGWWAWSAVARRGSRGSRASRRRQWPTAPGWEGRRSTCAGCTATRRPTTSAPPPSSSTSRRPSTSCGRWCEASTSSRSTSHSSPAASCGADSSRSGACATSTSGPAYRLPPAPSGSSASTMTSTSSASSSSAETTAYRTTLPSSLSTRRALTGGLEHW